MLKVCLDCTAKFSKKAKNLSVASPPLQFFLVEVDLRVLVHFVILSLRGGGSGAVGMMLPLLREPELCRHFAVGNLHPCLPLWHLVTLVPL